MISGPTAGKEKRVVVAPVKDEALKDTIKGICS